ncbi:MAG: EAL domain-containing protein [Mycobacteriales bacterium]|nr:EAL domain-containing response regulator [Frankia sp.]
MTKQLLVVEDDPVQASLAEALVSAGAPEFRVRRVDCLDDARSALRGAAFDCVLLDLNLPDTSGVETVRLARSAAREVPIVVVTATDDEAVALQALGHGAQDYVVKSAIDDGKLARALRFAVARRRASDDVVDALLGRDDVDPDDAALPATMNAAVVTRDLRAALARDELVLHYQPKVDLRSGALAGVEALIRWQHPERGLVYPDAFIGIAERTGLISELTSWTITTALAARQQWAADGLTLNTAVNVSPVVLCQQDVQASVCQALRTSGAAASVLTLEITESGVMKQPAAAQRALTSLAGMGVRLSLDDFGTGYSSLRRLRELPLDELKIDKSFVMAMATDARDAAIVRSTVELGHRLGKQVVAEGVETADTRILLADLGCDLGQGYLWSRPVTAADVPTWARTCAAE